MDLTTGNLWACLGGTSWEGPFVNQSATGTTRFAGPLESAGSVTSDAGEFLSPGYAVLAADDSTIALRPNGPTSYDDQFYGGGGAWATFSGAGAQRNIIDDGSGNMTVAGSLTVAGEELLFGSGGVIYIQDENGGSGLAIKTNGAGTLTAVYTFSQGVTRNTFDDGSGNAQFTGSVAPGNPGTGDVSRANLFSGSGVPSNTYGAEGDYYFRTDTPSTANQRIYVKTGAAWTGIV
jgi:hypothetical protein